MITFAPGNLRIPKWTRPVYMVAAGTTDFRKRYPEKKLEELCMMAFRMLLEENDLKMRLLLVQGTLPIGASRLLEAMAMLWVTYGFRNDHWTHAFSLLGQKR